MWNRKKYVKTYPHPIVLCILRDLFSSVLDTFNADFLCPGIQMECSMLSNILKCL